MKKTNTYTIKFLYSHEVSVNATNQDEAIEKALEISPRDTSELIYQGFDERDIETIKRI